ncbi:MAG: hypothetical protein JRE65_14480 [Deltaproteobacteria bacterium]|nr:hypothetical protein [Deltaproteobacteria bacterium]
MILDNIEIPDPETVPKAMEFKGSDDLFWRIPDTDITVARCNEGRRNSAWLFSPDTVSHTLRTSSR